MYLKYSCTKKRAKNVQKRVKTCKNVHLKYSFIKKTCKNVQKRAKTCISNIFGPILKTCTCEVHAAWGRVSQGLTVLWKPKCTCLHIELKNVAHHRTSTGLPLTLSPVLPTFATCTTHISAQFTMRWFPSTYLLTSRAGTIYLLQRNAQMTAMQKKMSTHNGAK